MGGWGDRVCGGAVCDLLVTALRNIKDAMDFWIERAQELGRPVPEPKGERLMPA